MVASSPSALKCGKCKAPLPPEMFNTPGVIPCSSCGLPLHAALFPSVLSGAVRGKLGESIQIEGEASCFYHSEQKAVITCESCGRFLCELCHIELSGQHICSACVQLAKEKSALKELDRDRILYDEVALALSLLPLLMWPATCITAPATVVVVIRCWKRPSSVIPRTKIRFVLALLVAGLQIFGWIALLVAVLWG